MMVLNGLSGHLGGQETPDYGVLLLAVRVACVGPAAGRALGAGRACRAGAAAHGGGDGHEPAVFGRLAGRPTAKPGGRLAAADRPLAGGAGRGGTYSRAEPPSPVEGGRRGPPGRTPSNRAGLPAGGAARQPAPDRPGAAVSMRSHDAVFHSGGAFPAGTFGAAAGLGGGAPGVSGDIMGRFGDRRRSPCPAGRFRRA